MIRLETVAPRTLLGATLSLSNGSRAGYPRMR
jgi:hypothetical protein